MKTVIFGCGYVGLALMRFWSDQSEHAVTGTTTSPEKCHQLNLEGVDLVLAHSAQLDDVIQLTHQAEVLVVCIAGKKNAKYRNTYLKTAETIYQSLQGTSNLKHLIYLSSTSVYGDQQGKPVDETSPLLPTSDNSQILVDTERLYLEKISQLVPVSVLRLGGIYGPGRTYMQRLDWLKKQQPIKGADMMVNAVHQEDIVSAIDWVVKHHLLGVYNVCADTSITKAELYNEVSRFQKSPPLQWDEAQRSLKSNKSVNNAKLKATGFHFQHNSTGPEAWINPLAQDKQNEDVDL